MVDSLTQNLIDDAWDFSNPAQSAIRFENAIAAASTREQRLQLQTQLARALGLQRRFDDAHRMLDEVDHGANAPDGAWPHAQHRMASVRIRASLERGRLFNSDRQRENALPLFERAFQLARDLHDDHLAIDAAHMIAIIHGAQSQFSEALRWNCIALEIADHSSQPRGRQWRASLHNNLGWALHDQGDFTAALTHFEFALRCRIEQQHQAEIRIARWCVARCLRSLGRVEESLQIQQQLHGETEAIGETPDGFVHEEIAECLLALGRNTEAQPHFASAHRILSASTQLCVDEPARMDRLAVLGSLQKST